MIHSLIAACKRGSADILGSAPCMRANKGATAVANDVFDSMVEDESPRAEEIVEEPGPSNGVAHTTLLTPSDPPVEGDST